VKPPELSLDALIHEAEAARVLQICNACRYCESFCAVFPAMIRRLEFPPADVHFMANLCHNCGACLHACQYAPPHEFAVNVPQALARVRAKTWADHAWPQSLACLYERNGLALALALAASLALFLALAAARHGALWAVPAGGFYAVFPHGLMVSLFAPLFGFVLLALAVSVARFWRTAPPGRVSAAAAAEAAGDALRLKYLDGGHGEGCNEEDDRWTLARRRYHHLTFYGFLLCFAATCVATLYHYAFGWEAPHAWTSLPKLLGVPGGLALVAGTAGLAHYRWHRHAQHQVEDQRPMDMAFIGLLFLTGASGLTLALAHGTVLMPLLLCVHLGAVMAFFATMPYGKFAHAVFRSAALLKWSIERRQPSRLRLGSE
jgi:citrate/tricarballylate utilization protein